METPLIVKSSASGKKLNSTCAVIVFTLLCLYISSIFLHCAKPEEKIIGGGEEINAIMAKIYFQVAHLVDHMTPGDHYKNPMAVVVTLEPFEEHCTDSTPMCTDICQVRMLASTPDAEPPACRHRETGGDMECWDTQKMDCWFEGSTFSDSAQKWIIQRHDKNSMEVSWLHLKKHDSPHVHIFLFGVGDFQPHNDVCVKLAAANQLLQSIKNVPVVEPIIFGGHSSGSAWAMCANFYLSRLRPQHYRRLIASGPMLATSSFMKRYQEVKPWETDMYLLNAAVLNGPHNTPVLLPDLEGIRNSPEGITMPQFGFSCIINEGDPIQCASPQPVINIAQAFAFWTNRQQDSMMEQFRAGMAHTMPYMHSIDMYQDCWKACWDYFRTTNWNLNPNVFHYSKIDPTNPMTAALANLGIRWSDYLNLLSTAQGGQIPVVPADSPAGPSSDAGPSASAGSSADEVPATDVHISLAAMQSLQTPPSSDHDSTDQEQGEITPTYDF